MSATTARSARIWWRALRPKAGYIFGFDQDIRITDAFFLGGANLRGFRSRGVGPRDLNTGDFLGGNKYFAGTVQLSFPLGLPEEYRIRGRAFSDFGTLFDNDFEDLAGPPNGFTDEASIRASVGAGITWDSPFGPFAFDLAYPFLKEGTDKEEYLPVQRWNEVLISESHIRIPAAQQRPFHAAGSDSRRGSVRARTGARSAAANSGTIAATARCGRR